MEYHVRHWWLSLAYHILAKATDEGPSAAPAEVGYCLSHLCGLSPSQCRTKRGHFNCVSLFAIVAPHSRAEKVIQICGWYCDGDCRGCLHARTS